MYIIDLEDYRSGGSRVYAGRDRGAFVRMEQRLAEREQDPTAEFEVRVPKDTFSVNASFFLGLFGDTIKEIGEDEFRRRFHFTGRPISRVYESAIREAINSESPLPSI